MFVNFDVKLKFKTFYQYIYNMEIWKMLYVQNRKNLKTYIHSKIMFAHKQKTQTTSIDIDK